jgi:peptidoglycan/LPS O-acetylase OafA/YrhL
MSEQPITHVSAVPQHATTAKASGTRVVALDALRGVAALGVVLLHFTTDFHRDLTPTRNASFSAGFGAYGVHLFFLISGFVILMTAEKARRPRDFVISRWSRLYPPYWAALVFTTTLLMALPVADTPEPASLLRRAVVNLTMFQTWLRIGNVDSVYWTLQVEMSFYLILLVLIWRKATHHALSVMTGLVVLALFDHVLVPRPWSAPYAYLREILFLEHAYLFTAGMVLYKLRRGFKPHYALILLACVLCPLTANYFPNTPLVDACIASALTLLVYLATSGEMEWLATKPLLYLGSISYSLYLSHHWTGLILLKHLNQAGAHPDVALALALVAVLLLAAALAHFVEKPSQAWFRQKKRAARAS